MPKEVRKGISIDESGRTASVRLGRLEKFEQPRAHQYVAEQLRREIALGLIFPEQALPAERELAQIFGVARATVQLAVRELESEGVVRVRRGRGGGVFVTSAPEGAISKRRLIQRVRRDRDVIGQALLYRSQIEPAATELAAAARPDHDVARLRHILEQASRTSEDDRFTRLDTRFHISLARASGNQFLVEGIERVRLTLQDAILVLPESRLWQSRTIREHERIVSAIEIKDSAAARKAMARHIAHTEHNIRALLKAL